MNEVEIHVPGNAKDRRKALRNALRRRMAVLGSKKSPAKTAAAQKNGVRGGRPKK